MSYRFSGARNSRAEIRRKDIRVTTLPQNKASERASERLRVSRCSRTRRVGSDCYASLLRRFLTPSHRLRYSVEHKSHTKRWDFRSLAERRLAYLLAPFELQFTENQACRRGGRLHNAYRLFESCSGLLSRIGRRRKDISGGSGTLKVD